MQLKSLQLQGFKSFPDKTVLNFEEGITAIVGPNGSGKSNVADAIRWVLGEQSTKNLRGKKMEDVIFGGAKSRSAAGFCSVAITFDNEDRSLPMDTDEVCVLRKLYRSGESEYRINDVAARLRDVNELFMDTGVGKDGYSIIGQGKIADIVGAKNKERREIFEEAAGISRFRYRRSEAEKRLEDTYENLLRLKDIMVELEDRVGPLKIQAEKAQKFLELSEKKKNLEISIWVNQSEFIKQKLDKLKQDILSEKNNLGDIEAILEDKEKQIEQLYKKIQEAVTAIDEKRREIDRIKAEIAAKDSHCAVLKNEIEHNIKDIETLKEESLKGDKQGEVYLEQIEKNNEILSQANKKAAEILKEKRLLEEKLLENKNSLKTITVKLEEVVREKMAFESQISNTMLLGASSKTLIDETKSRLGYYDNVKEDGEKNLATAKREVEDCKKLINELEKLLEETKNKIDAYKIKSANSLKRLDKLEGEKNSLIGHKNEKNQRIKILEDLEKNMDGMGHSVRHIMSKVRHGVLKGVEGTVASVINVEAQFAVAIETALGAKAENIIVENESCAKDGINILKNDRAGRATFLPLNTIKPQSLITEHFKNAQGYLGTADTLVQCDDRYRHIIENLLGKTAIVTDIDAGIRLAKSQDYAFKIVTLDGQRINTGGSFTGGSVSQRIGLLSRKAEITELLKDITSLDEQINSLEPDIAKYQAEKAKNEAEIQALEQEIRRVTEEKITYSAELKRLSGNFENSKLEIARCEKEREDSEKKLAELIAQNTSYEDVIIKLREQAAESGQKADQLREEKIKVSEAVLALEQQNTKLSFAQLEVNKDCENLIAENERLKTQFADIGSSKEALEQKIASLNASTLEIKNNITRIENNRVTSLARVETLEQEIKQSIVVRNQVEEQTTALRTSEKDLIAKREKSSSALSMIEEKKFSIQKSYDDIIAKLWDEYNLVKSDASKIAEPIFNLPESEQKLRSIKNEIKALGSVNVAAVEEYKEVSQRYEFMKAQLDDVEKTRLELKKMINDITKNMQTMFCESFKEIAENFTHVFKELFGGGNAKLTLTEPDNVLESGIDIFVEPPGKIIKNIALLSGGEQAFVAIAIYFAILKVRPTPFCVLDEIEAALDEVNVTRYADYLQKYKDKIRFITITHRRGTMEAADLLYGVTMQQEGISKVLKLDLSDVEHNVGIVK